MKETAHTDGERQFKITDEDKWETEDAYSTRDFKEGLDSIRIRKEKLNKKVKIYKILFISSITLFCVMLIIIMNLDCGFVDDGCMVGENPISDGWYFLMGFFDLVFIVTLIMFLVKRKKLKKIKKTYSNIKTKFKSVKAEEKERITEELAAKEFAKKQQDKGLKEYDGEWLNEIEYKKEIWIDKFIEKCDEKNNYKGLFMVCDNCDYVWKIKKDYGLPARCGKCNSEYIELDRRKIYLDLMK